MTLGQTGNFCKKPDFSNPYKNDNTTFGQSPDKVDKNIFERDYKTEFRGRHSPPPTKYTPSVMQFKPIKYESKTLGRDERICPLVMKG